MINVSIDSPVCSNYQTIFLLPPWVLTELLSLLKLQFGDDDLRLSLT